jgi:hypothetical protein
LRAAEIFRMTRMSRTSIARALRMEEIADPEGIVEIAAEIAADAAAGREVAAVDAGGGTAAAVVVDGMAADTADMEEAGTRPASSFPNRLILLR